MNLRRIAPLALLLAACGSGGVRPAGEDPRCGDGVRDPNEECDKGAGNGPNTGCEVDCTLSCVPLDPSRGDSHCDLHDACKGTGKCGDDNACHYSGALAPGATCAAGKICKSGACQAPVCGDGILSAGEECDDGKVDGSQGCASGCRFSCVSTDPARNCAATNPCQGASACDDATHQCAPRSNLPDGTGCGTGHVCRAGACVPTSCGNGAVEPGEECEPPNTATCDATCHSVVCGNGRREGAEQCDDGNKTNLDGCDASCKFEQNVRANKVTMQYATSTTCTANALGAAIGSAARSTLQGQLDASVKGGAMTMAFRVLGLGDLTGTNAASLTLGAVTGTPEAAPPGFQYDGNADLDWWYAVPATDVDAQRLPLAQVPGKIVSKVLTAGPGRMTMTIALGGGPIALSASNVKLRSDVGDALTLSESSGATPGHVAAEHDNPSLVSFGSLANGQLCGNVSAASLAAVPAPASVQSGGSVACIEGFTATNTTLDVVVKGCKVLGGLATAIYATQPDQVDAAAPAGGAGGPYTFVLTGTHVTGCKDWKGAVVADLTKCLNAAAYSTYLSFTADRVILK